jgi:hypothetical protein
MLQLRGEGCADDIADKKGTSRIEIFDPGFFFAQR